MKEFRGNLASASREARKLNAQLMGGGGTGSIRRWSNGQDKITYVPDNAYSTEGLITIHKNGDK
jgi:hypothetical protein